jgi:KDO2-lipid IV(A) lauroyltransferase
VDPRCPIVNFASWLVRLLPLGLALWLGRLLGLVWYYLLPVRKATALSNVRRSVGRELTPGQCRRLVRRSFQRQGIYLMEVLRLPGLTPELADRLIEWHGLDVLDDALSRGKGVILVASHLDNVDLAGCALSVKGYPIAVVAKKLGSKSAAKFIVRVRETTGLTLLPTHRAGERIREILAGNGIVALIVDQHVRPQHSIVCRFFDQLAATTHAPARFGTETGATLVTGLFNRKGMSRYHAGRIERFELEAPFADDAANLRHNTERINRIVEEWIRQYPEQWLWPHKRWKVHDGPDGWDVPEELQHLVAGTD